MTDHHSSRGIWTSRVGFIFAAAGSAIGLGNIWRFPYVAGENGGAAFVMIYVFFIIVIGLPIMISEITIGRNTRKNPYGAFRKLKPSGFWKLAGGLGIVTGTLILSFYVVIAGFTIGYFFLILSGRFNGISDVKASGEIFASFASDPVTSVGLSLLFILLTAFIVIRGVSDGIEKWSKVFMPALLILLLLLVFRALSLNGAIKGLEFYLRPDLNNVSVSTFIQALGQALFSLSLGGGGMMTYGSYLSRKENLVKASGYIAVFDTMIAILAGLIIFPALFAMGGDPAGGPGLIFITLPSLIMKMPGGVIFGASIFILLTLAALTTTISLLEIPVAYFVDEWKWKRKKATIIASLVVLILAIPSALSLGASGWLSRLPFIHLGFMDFIVIVFANYALVIGALLIAVFVGYSWGIQSALREIELYGNYFRLKRIWTILLKFICPVAIISIIGYMVFTGNYF